MDTGPAVRPKENQMTINLCKEQICPLTTPDLVQDQPKEAEVRNSDGIQKN